MAITESLEKQNSETSTENQGSICGLSVIKYYNIFSLNMKVWLYIVSNITSITNNNIVHIEIWYIFCTFQNKEKKTF
jgi:hypothetical protein